MYHPALPGAFGEQGVDDPGRIGKREEGGNAERTGRDREKNGRWSKEVKVTAAIKRSQ